MSLSSSAVRICPVTSVLTKSSPLLKKVPIVRDYESIPTPRSLPIVGTTLDLMKSGGASYLHKYCDDRHASLGPLYREKLGTLECIFISDASLTQRVFSSEGQFPKHIVPESWVLFNEMKGIKRGLFFMDGPEWSQNRKSLNRIFLKKETISRFSGDFNQVVTDLLSRWDEDGTDGITTKKDVERELYNWSIESMGTMVFGRRLGCVSSKPSSDVETIHDFVGCIRQLFVESCKLQVIPAKLAHSFDLPVWRRFVTAAERALSLARGYVEDNVQQMVEPNGTQSSCPAGDISKVCPFHGGDQNVIETMMNQEGIERKDVVNIVTDMFLASADTTSHAMQWALYLLARNPETQQKVLNEVNDAISRVGSVEQLLSEDHLNQMPYVKGVIKESLRLYPVAPFISRILDKDIVLNGYRVPSGKVLNISLYTLGRDPKYFPNPDKFMPERWVRDEKTNRHQTVHKFHLSTLKEVSIKLRMITTPEEPIELRMEKRK